MGDDAEFNRENKQKLIQMFGDAFTFGGELSLHSQKMFSISLPYALSRKRDVLQIDQFCLCPTHLSIFLRIFGLLSIWRTHHVSPKERLIESHA